MTTATLRPALAALLLAAAGLGAQDRPIRVLVLTGQTDPSHKWRETMPVLRDILGKSGRFEVAVTEQPGANCY